MNATSLNAPVLIIGGGIGGLVLALELAKRNISSQIYEQAEEFSDIGAGLQLSPNAVRRLKNLGLETALGAVISAPDQICLSDGLTNAHLKNIPLGHSVLEKYGAPYWVVARKDLHAILLAALEEYDCVSIHLGKKFINYTQNPPVVETNGLIRAHMEDGSTGEGVLLIGADGVWSRVRHMFAPEQTPQQTEMIAWRALIDADTAPQLFKNASDLQNASNLNTTGPNSTQVWFGPNSHLVQYRVMGGDKINLVAVTKGKALTKDWVSDLPAEALFEEMRPWNKSIRQAVMAVEGWSAWPLMMLAPFKPWSRGRALLLGDAAHAILPFLAQGAAMAIEDASLLAELIENHPDQPDKIVDTFQAQRFRRCQRVFSKSVYQLQFYHASSYLAHIRNLGVKALPASWMLKQYDWLYKY